MALHAAKEAVQRLWGRRWFRRVSYGLVAGATVYTVVPWLATRPVVLRWAVGRLDALVREETGLSLDIGRVDLHPGRGAVALHDVRLGGDLLRIERIEVHADVWSLLSTERHIHSVVVDRPRLRLTEAGLAAIRLKERPPRRGPLPQIRLDDFQLSRGEIEIPETLRGIPALSLQFELQGTGLGPNHVQVDLTAPRMTVQGPAGPERGRIDVNGEASESGCTVQGVYLRLGGSQVRLTGSYRAGVRKAPDQVEVRLSGVADLAQAARWGGLRPPITGDVDLSGTLNGSVDRPAWTFTVDGQDLKPMMEGLLPGDLSFKGSGGLSHAKLDRFRWTSPQGELDADGSWSKEGAIQASLQGEGLDLDVVGQILRLTEFRGAKATLRAQVKTSAKGERLADPGQWQASLRAAFVQHGREAGGLEAALDRGIARVDRLALNLESLAFDGQGQAFLGPRGLIRLESEGKADLDASQVARALSAWRIVDLDMEGRTQGRAQVRWSRPKGLELKGAAEIGDPRWHGARADSLRAEVEILGSDLWIRDINLRKGEGWGGGELWLTWADRAPGQDQIDMCYSAFRLPVAEGLRAVDLKDDEGRDLPISGTGSGWVRLHGPFRTLQMDGQAQAESGEVYGIKIPAVSSGFSMDLDNLRLRLTDARIAARPGQFGQGPQPPQGTLALAGQADMDFQNWTWWVDLGGSVDSRLLALPGPWIQAQVQARLLGPITSPFGGLVLPEGRVELNRGRLLFGGQTLEGFEGAARLEQGGLSARFGFEGMARPFLEVQARREGLDVSGTSTLTLSPETARTEDLARSLTGDLLEDLNLAATLQGSWKHDQDLAWTGSLDRLSARFHAFELHQTRPSPLSGGASGAEVDIALEGGATDPANAAAAQAAQIRLSGRVPFSATAPLSLQTQGSADLAHLKSILDRIMEVDEYSLQSQFRVQGTSRFDLLAHGTYGEPLLDGTLSLDKGRAYLRGYQGVEDLQAEVLLKDRTLAIPEDKPLRGTLAHGALVASGAATWQLGGIEAYAVKGSLEDFQLRDVPDGLDLQGTLQATLEGTAEGGALQGKLWADRLGYHTEVKLADLILRSALSDSGGFLGMDPDDPLDRIRLELDLDLRAPWTFDTNLLKLEGRTQGAFQVLGSLAHPLPKGTLVFQPGGRITNIFPAGDMVVDRGSLSFSESRPMDPLITLQGMVTSIPGYTVNLDARGTLSNLSIVASSTPSLRQDEVVAILINPGNVANVGTAGASSGATQGAITSGLASASTGILTTLAFAPLQEQLRRSMGLDRVNVAVRTTRLGTTETEVTLGKSLSLLGQRSAFVLSHKKSGELSITFGQMEWRLGDFILHLGFSQSAGTGLSPSGEIRHTWTPK